MADKRGKDSPTSMRVKLKVATVESFVEKFAANVNRSGMFLSSKAPKSVGTTLRFELLSNDGKVKLLKGEALVAWVRDDGMGLRFKKLDGESRKLVERMVARKRAMGEPTGETVPVPPPPDEAKGEDEPKADAHEAKADADEAKPDEAQVPREEARPAAEEARAEEARAEEARPEAEEARPEAEETRPEAEEAKGAEAEAADAGRPEADAPPEPGAIDDVEAFLAADGPALLETLEQARTIARALMANGGTLGMDELERLLAPGEGISINVDDASASLASTLGVAPVLRQPMKPLFILPEPVPEPAHEPPPQIPAAAPAEAATAEAEPGPEATAPADPAAAADEPTPPAADEPATPEASAPQEAVPETLEEPALGSAPRPAPESLVGIVPDAAATPTLEAVPEPLPEQHSEVIARAAADAIADAIPDTARDLSADLKLPSNPEPIPRVSEAMTEEDRWGALPELPDDQGLDAVVPTPPMGTVSQFGDESSGSLESPQDFDTDPPGTGYASSDAIDELGENTRETSVADMMDMMEVDVLEDAGELAEELGARDLDATDLERIAASPSTPGTNVDLEESTTLAVEAQKTPIPDRSKALGFARKAPIRELPPENFEMVEELDLNDASLGIEVELEEDIAAAEREAAGLRPPPNDPSPPKRGGFFKKLFGK